MCDLADINTWLRDLTAAKNLITPELIQATGEDAGIVTPTGKFLWSPTKGRTFNTWDAVALAAGATRGLIATHMTTG